MQRTCCEKRIYVFNSWSEASAVGSGVFSDTFRCFSLLSMKHPGAFCLRVCMRLVYCLPVCVICSCPLMRWRSAVPKGLFPVFSSEIFVAFYSLIKPAGLPWAGCVWGALSRWGRGRVCVYVWAYWTLASIAKDHSLIAGHKSMTRITEAGLCDWRTEWRGDWLVDFPQRENGQFWMAQWDEAFRSAPAIGVLRL